MACDESKKEWQSSVLKSVFRQRKVKMRTNTESFANVSFADVALLRRLEGPVRLRSALNGQHQFREEPNIGIGCWSFRPLKIQLYVILFLIISAWFQFCFPGGMEVQAIERTPSMRELNEILLGQEHLQIVD
ncbi:hypothetical protein Tco_1422586, partial [Tanacetum coccineum]